jgi:hypothetical protein
MFLLRDRITKRDLAILKIFSPIILIVFLSVVAYHELKPPRYTPVKFGSEINMKVLKMRHYKGQVILNDSIVLPYNCPEVVLLNKKAPYNYKPDSKRKFKMGANYKPPFRILKEKNTEIFTIVDWGDTSYIKLNGAKDTLTHIDLFRKLFKK